MDPAAEFRVGEVIDRRYLLKRQIARGGMAAIFEAEHVHTGRRLALKGLLDEVCRDASARKRLLHEGRALERCRGRHVVDVIDVGLDGERPFVALELLEGRALDGLLTARARLPLPVAVEVLAELCAALEIVHQAGLVHRDVKPGNLFIVREESARDRVKLIDFGIARLPAADVAEKLTRVGERMGTREYMSPEQLLTMPLDRRADLFSAMVVFFECVSGELPFPTGLYDRPPPPLSSLAPGVPTALDEVVARALERDPGARFASASELSAVVHRAAGVSAPVSLLDYTLPAVAPQPRVFRRAPYVTPCRALTADQRVFDGRTADLSEGGVLALFPSAPAEGQTVRLRFCLPITGRAINVDAVPRWQRTARFQAAMGLEFVQLPAEAREEIRNFVRLMSDSGGAPAAAPARSRDERETLRG